MSRQTYWTNSDGLVVGFGTRTVETNSATAVSTGGARQQLVVPIRGGSEILDSDVSAQLIYGAVIPANSLLESAKLFVTTAFAGATAVLDIGLYKRSDGTAVDDDGIDSAIAVATLADNAVVACDGALIGTVLANDSKVGVSYDTAAFTAGEATLVIEYIPDQQAS